MLKLIKIFFLSLLFVSANEVLYACDNSSILNVELDYSNRINNIKILEQKIKNLTKEKMDNASHQPSAISHQPSAISHHLEYNTALLGWYYLLDNRVQDAKKQFNKTLSTSLNCLIAQEGLNIIYLNDTDYSSLVKSLLKTIQLLPPSENFLMSFYFSIFKDFYYQTNLTAEEIQSKLLNILKNKKFPAVIKDDVFYFLKDNFPLNPTVQTLNKIYQPEIKYINTFKVIGTFQKFLKTDLNYQFEPERIIKNSEYKTVLASSRWFDIMPFKHSANIPLLAFFNYASRGAGYALVYVWSEKKQSISFTLTATTNFKLFINNCEILSRENVLLNTPNAQTASVSLLSGWNKILVKIHKVYDEDNFSLAYKDNKYPIKLSRNLNLNLEKKVTDNLRMSRDLSPIGGTFLSRTLNTKYCSNYTITKNSFQWKNDKKKKLKIKSNPLISLFSALYFSKLDYYTKSESIILSAKGKFGKFFLLKLIEAYVYSGLKMSARNYKSLMAKQSLDELITSGFVSPFAYQLLGEYFVQIGLYPQSEENFKKLIETTNDKNPYAHLGLANIYFTKGLTTLGYNEISKIAGKNHLDNRIFAVLKDYYFSQKNYKKAFEYSSKWAVAQSFDLGNAFTYPQILVDFNKFEEAEKLINYYLKIFGQRASLFYRLAMISFKKNNLNETLKYIDEALKITPYWKDLYILKANILELLNYNKENTFVPNLEIGNEENRSSKTNTGDYAITNYLQAYNLDTYDMRLEELLAKRLNKKVNYEILKEKVKTQCEQLSSALNIENDITVTNSDSVSQKTDAKYILSENFYIVNKNMGYANYHNNKILIFNNDGAQQFGEIVLPSNNFRLLDAKVINSDGKISYTNSVKQEGGSLVLSMPDLKEGSILEYSYMNYAPANFWETGEFHSPMHYLRYLSTPVDNEKVTFVLPANLKVKYMTLNSAAEKQSTSKNFLKQDVYKLEEFNNSNIYAWQSCTQSEIIPEQNMPPLSEVLPTTYLSSFNDKNVNNLWRGNIKSESQVTPFLKKAALDIVGQEKSKIEQIKKLYLYITKEIADGDNFDSGAEETLITKKGDTSQKVLLLKALLASLGIKSYYAVSYGRDDKTFLDLTTLAPYIIYYNQFLFVEIPLPDGKKKDLWLDLSSKYLTPGAVNFGVNGLNAFIFDETKGFVKQIPQSSLEQDASNNRLECSLNLEGDIICKATVEEKGSSGFIRGYLIDPVRRDKFIKQLLNFIFPGVVINKTDFLNIEDVSQPLIIKVEFTVKKFVRKKSNGEMTFSVVAPKLSLGQTLSTGKRRIHPLNIVTPTIANDISIIRLPENIEIKKLPQELNLTSEFGEYHLNLKNDGRDIIIERKVFFPSQTIPISKYKDCLDIAKQIDQKEMEKVVLQTR